MGESFHSLYDNNLMSTNSNPVLQTEYAAGHQKTPVSGKCKIDKHYTTNQYVKEGTTATSPTVTDCEKLVDDIYQITWGTRQNKKVMPIHSQIQRRNSEGVELFNDNADDVMELT